MEWKPAGDVRFGLLAKVRLLVLLSFFAGLSQTLLAATPGVEGQWGPRINFTTVPVSAAVLPNGKLLIFSSWDRYSFTSGTGARDKTYANLYDPATGQVTEFLVTQTNHDMFCPGTAFLEDGRLMVNGGGPQVTTTSIYDFSGNQWVRDVSMSRRRWYNGSTTLPSGGVFTLGGIPDDGIGELWTSGVGWSVLAGARVTPMTVDAGSYMSRSEQHPKVLVAPNGRLFAAGPTPNMQWYDTANGGSVQFAGRRGDDIYAQSNVTVMFDVGQILTAGGNPNYDGVGAENSPSSANAYVINITSGVTSRKIASMRYGRAYANGVVLPDGRVLVIGGISTGKAFTDTGAVFVPEMFNPDTETWTPMATQATPRTYHSTALLLPDGRVFSGGGGLCGNCSVNHADGEIYSPPYLFQGPRPVIQGVPTLVGYDAPFSIATTGDVARFTLVRLSSTTHTVNTDQRFLPLASAPNGGGSFTVTSPLNANLAPPGYYMLFALSATGVPSVSKIMKLSAKGAPVGGGGTSFRYVKLEEVSEVSGKAFGSAAELNVLDTSGNTIGRTGWVASADSAETSSPAAKAIDGNPATLWHTRFVGASPPPPHWLVADMGTSHPVGGFRYLPRQDGSSNGRIAGYRFYVSTDGVNWGKPVAQGTFANNSAEKTVIFSTAPSNQPPVVTDPGNQSSVMGTNINLAIGASDPNGDTLSYSATGLPAGLSINVGTGFITGTVSTGGTSTVTVTVRDGKGGIAATSFTWTVTSSASTGGGFRYVKLEEVSEVSGKAFGSAAELKILDTSGTTIGRTGWVASADSAETSSPAAKAIDGNPATLWHTRFVGASPPPPHWLVVDMGTSHPVGGFRYLPRQDGSSNGRIAGYRFYVSTDGVSWGTPVAQGTFANTPAEKTVIFSAAPPNQPPVVTNPGNQTSVVGTNINLAIGASDPNGDTLSYSATGLPAGLSINAGTGVITGTVSTAGTSTVTVTVSDGRGGTASTSFSLRINNALALDPIASPPRTAGTPVSYTAVPHGGVNPRFSWSFGDGTAAMAPAATPGATHTFAQPGRYVVTVTATDDVGANVVREFVQAVHQPLTATPPTVSMSIAYEGNRDRVWNVNPDNDTATVFDALTEVKIAEIAVGQRPRSVAVAHDGRIWVANQQSASISIIAPDTLQAVQTVNLPAASQPYGMVFDSAGSRAFVALESMGLLLRLAPTTGVETGRVAVGPNPRHLSVNADGTRVFVSRFITPPVPGEATAAPNTSGRGGEVVVVDSSSLAIVKTVVLQHSEATDTAAGGSGVPNYLGPAVIAPDGRSAWVPSKQDNIKRGTLRDGRQLTFETTLRAISSRIDLASLAEDYPARMDHDNSGVAATALFNPTSDYLFVALEASREVAVIDPYSHHELMRFAVGRAPQGLALSSDGSTLYVQNFMDRTVGVYDIETLMQTGDTRVRLIKIYSSVAVEDLPAQVLLGKQLFYDARDPRLARDRYISCAACHNDGGHDGRVWDLTGFGEGLRNTISLRGHAGTAHGRLHWSSNFDEVQDFEQQIRGLAAGTGLMNDGDFNAGTRSQPLGDPKAGRSADLDALAAYVASLNTFAPSPHRNADGTLTADAVAGETVFQIKDCAQCHSGSNLTDSVTSSDTLHDIGTLKPSSGRRLGDTLTGIDTPTLRGVWASAPYLHDGSAATLSDAVSAHEGITFTPFELDRLSSYLQQLDSRTD